MKKKMNDKVKSVIVLTAICLVITALLAVTNSVTSPIIAKARAERIQASLKEVLPDAGEFTEVPVPDGAPSTVKSVYKAADGSFAVVLATMSAYSSGDMGITAGVSPDGRLVGVSLTSYQESKDFGKDTYPKNYVGVTEDDYAEVDVFAGVTYSSKAFKGAIGDAFAVIKMLNEGGAD
jgi:electron transport complex protein RnfG